MHIKKLAAEPANEPCFHTQKIRKLNHENNFNKLIIKYLSIYFTLTYYRIRAARHVGFLAVDLGWRGV